MTSTKRWTVDVLIGEDEGATYAEAHLDGPLGEHLIGVGRASRHPDDPDVPEIGDEVAVARAVANLGHRLLVTAAQDIRQATHEEKVRLHG